ncbi:MAG TPA: NADAR family protein, partial [Asticcacaulis sp.]
MEEAIFFYTPDGPFGDFSNFAKFGVALDGVWWPTTEHYFQAQNFGDPAYQEKTRRASTPKQAADLGRTRALALRPDWDVARVDVMRRVVTTKFETHEALRVLLLSTGDRPLVESAPGDNFWGA